MCVFVLFIIFLSFCVCFGFEDVVLTAVAPSTTWRLHVVFGGVFVVNRRLLLLLLCLGVLLAQNCVLTMAAERAKEARGLDSITDVADERQIDKSKVDAVRKCVTLSL